MILPPIGISRFALSLEAPLKTFSVVVWTVLTLLLGACARESSDQELTLRPYQPEMKGLTGMVHIVASEVMAPLMRQWLADFQRYHPALRMILETGTSPQAADALAKGGAEVAGMTRSMTTEEERRFAETYGYRPVGLAVALDAVIVIVHQDNPVRGLTLAQLKSIFAEMPARERQSIEQWADVGLTGDWARAGVRRYGLDPAMATTQYFIDEALEGRPLRGDTVLLHDPAMVVSSVLLDRLGIGFTSIGYLRPGIRALGLGRVGDEASVVPSEQTVDTGQYPLGRALYLYVNQPPTGSLPPSIREFLRYVRSQEAQATVQQAHFYRLAPDHLLMPARAAAE